MYFWWGLGCFVPAYGIITLPYGVAHRAWDRDGAWCYIIGLNWLVRWARSFWSILRFPEGLTRYERAQVEAYQRGHEDARGHRRRAFADGIGDPVAYERALHAEARQRLGG